MTAVLHRSAQALLVVLLAGTVALLLAVAVVPPVLGWVPLAVLPGAAQPAVPTGSRIVVEPLDDQDAVARLAVGDVVAYTSGTGALAAHRIVEVGHDAQGTPRFTTGGDGAPAADGGTVTAAQVRGVVRYHVPWAGLPGTLLDAGQKRAGTVLVAAALLGHALWQAAAAVPGRRPGAGPGTERLDGAARNLRAAARGPAAPLRRRQA